MKKDYVKPETAVENVMVETMIATSGAVGGENTDESPVNERRGGWGDLWN